MQGWSPNDVSLDKVISGVVTNEPVTKEYNIYSGGALNQRLKIVASGVTVVGSITAKHQHAIGSDWVDGKSVTISANGIVYITYNVEVAADQTHMPLMSKGRVVITTTNAGDAVTIDEVDVLQQL